MNSALDRNRRSQRLDVDERSTSKAVDSPDLRTHRWRSLESDVSGRRRERHRLRPSSPTHEPRAYRRPTTWCASSPSSQPFIRSEFPWRSPSGSASMKRSTNGPSTSWSSSTARFCAIASPGRSDLRRGHARGHWRAPRRNAGATPRRRRRERRPWRTGASRRLHRTSTASLAHPVRADARRRGRPRWSHRSRRRRTQRADTGPTARVGRARGLSPRQHGPRRQWPRTRDPRLGDLHVGRPDRRS
jgi:hypothetical protein